MIQVNKRDFDWWKGMTIQSLLDAKRYTFRMIIVKVNGKVVPKDQYAMFPIHDGDNVDVIHLMGGG